MLISVDDLKKVFVGNSSMNDPRQEKWAAVEGQVGHHAIYLKFDVFSPNLKDILEEEYSVSCSGKPCLELLQVVRLLHGEECVHSSPTQSHFNVKFRDLNTKEKSLLRRYMYVQLWISLVSL